MATHRVLVAGGGGFIGGHLVADLRRRGVAAVRSADLKPPGEWHQIFDDVENVQLDLRDLESCRRAVAGVDVIYNLAADMGGMGFIENNKALCMLSVLINTHLLVAARDAEVERFFFASSACVYAAHRQALPDTAPLRESDVYPAMPEDGYGWEKLFSERMCRHFAEDYGLDVRIGRLHNAYGPHGTWNGGREKAPAAICRKIAEAALDGRRAIEVWGDGEQTRSFTFIDDCLEGMHRLMARDVPEPVNIGSSEMVTINQLVDTVSAIAGVEVERIHDLGAPLGVRGRSSDNSLARHYLDWEPSTSLRAGLEPTYAWILEQVRARAELGERAGRDAASDVPGPARGAP